MYGSMFETIRILIADNNFTSVVPIVTMSTLSIFICYGLNFCVPQYLCVKF